MNVPPEIQDAAEAYVVSMIGGSPAGEVVKGDEALLSHIERLARCAIEALMSKNDDRLDDYTEQFGVVSEILRLRHNRAIPVAAQSLLVGIARVVIGKIIQPYLT